MGVRAAIETYSILSIGDGLISQIPSLIISISSAFLVTKISSNHGVGQDLSRQFLKAGQPLTTRRIHHRSHVRWFQGCPNQFLLCRLARPCRTDGEEDRENAPPGPCQAPNENSA